MRRTPGQFGRDPARARTSALVDGGELEHGGRRAAARLSSACAAAPCGRADPAVELRRARAASSRASAAARRRRAPRGPVADRARQPVRVAEQEQPGASPGPWPPRCSRASSSRRAATSARARPRRHPRAGRAAPAAPRHRARPPPGRPFRPGPPRRAARHAAASTRASAAQRPPTRIQCSPRRSRRNSTSWRERARGCRGAPAAASPSRWSQRLRRRPR